MAALAAGLGFATGLPPMPAGSQSSFMQGGGFGAALDPLSTLQLLLGDPTGAGADFMMQNVGAPPAEGNPAAAAAAGAAPPRSGMLGSLFQGVQAPTAPKPEFGPAAPGVNPGATDVNVNMPNALSQALKLLPGAQRAGLPTLGQLIRGAI